MSSRPRTCSAVPSFTCASRHPLNFYTIAKASCANTGLPIYARELGFAEVETIDEDLGRSGSGLMERPGFQRLVTEVCEGQIGAVSAWKHPVWRATGATGIT